MLLQYFFYTHNKLFITTKTICHKYTYNELFTQHFIFLFLIKYYRIN